MNFLLLFVFTSFAWGQIDVTAVKELDEDLPRYRDDMSSEEDAQFSRQNRRYRPPGRIIPLKEILQSGTERGALMKGAPLRELETNKVLKTAEQIYVNFYTLEDELGFRYLESTDGKVHWKVRSRFIEPMKEELKLYEPPLRYTPAPTNIVKAEYDSKLILPPEFSFYAGFAVGDYMRDLFEDKKARTGTTTQYGAHLFTEWKLPIKVGAVLHYERTTYQLRSGARAIYSSPSLGPQLKTKDFYVGENPFRLQMQLRLSPLARVVIDDAGYTVKFNSTDLLFSLERPWKNGWGEFVVGAFFQNQWLNIRDQEFRVNIRASNQTNKSYGLMLSQVFQ